MKRETAAVVALVALLGCDKGQPTAATEPAPVVVATSAAVPAQPAAPNQAPTATIYDWQPRETVVVGGTRVGFGARGSDPDGDALRFSWDFDDGTTDVGEALHHVFHREGTFRVTLTVSDGRGGEAEAQVVVRARSIAGQWSVVDALHTPLEATIKQWPDSDFIQGTLTDRSVFEGHLVDPYGIRIEFWTNDRCIPSGVHEGQIISDVRQLYFQGRGCREIRFIRSRD
jgi:hypothetical protein